VITAIARRSIVAMAASGALLTGVLAMAAQADAATVYACVRKSSGTARIVSKHAKCKKGESKLSWNTVGPAGKNGATGPAGKNGANGTNGTNGTNGKNGTNGAVAGYSASAGDVTLTTSFESVVGKTLPAGSYLLSAKAQVDATGEEAGLAVAVCVLGDLTSDTELDFGVLDQGLGEFAVKEFEAGGTISLQAAVTLSAPAEIVVSCFAPTIPTKGEVALETTQLAALQVNSLS
jgi:hypothetical protein